MGGEVESSSILLFPLSLNLCPRRETFLTKEKDKEERASPTFRICLHFQARFSSQEVKASS